VGSFSAESHGNRLLATALAALTLEACPGYNYVYGPSNG